MSVCNINLGGQERTLRFNYYALTTYEKALVGLVKDWLDENDVRISAAYATIYAGLMGNARAENKGETFALPDVIDWVDACVVSGDVEGLQLADQVFAATQIYKDWQEKKTAAVSKVVEQITAEKKNLTPTSDTTELSESLSELVDGA